MVTDANDQVRIRAEAFAREEMEGYLNSEYDTDKIFNRRVFDFSASGQYKVGDLVIKSTGEQYVCILDATGADIEINTKFILDAGLVYETYDDEEGVYEPGDTVANAVGIKYLCIKDAPAGTDINDPEYFYLKRNDLMVMLYCDIALYHYHARLNPNQVPQLRTDRYLDAEKKLKLIRRKELTPSIPRTDANEDGTPDTGSIAWISNTKRENYF